MTFKKINTLAFAGLATLLLAVLPGRVYSAAAEDAAQQAPSQITVSGKVTDASGKPIIAVTVVNLSTGAGVVTNSEGEYTINATPESTLQFSFLGYSSVEQRVGSQTRINVTLEDESTTIDDVIVIGYGTTTRRRATGAVDQVTSSVIQDRPVANAKQALQGASPSIVIQNRGYNPNSDDVNINIRGLSSMNENQPLLVIDGLISDWAAFNRLNPSDIESVSILKDAGTAAIYGSRSGNGVILVTTKKGRKNQTPTVSITTSVGWQDPQQLFHPIEGYKNATLYNEYLYNSGKEAMFTAEDIRKLRENGDRKWGIYELTQTALQQNYNVSVAGGGENSTYMISAGYMGQQSNYIGDYGINRYNFRTNLTAEYGRFKITGLMSYVRNNDRSTTGSSIEVNATRMPAYYYLAMKDPETGKYLLNNYVTDFNGLGMLEEGGYNKTRNDYVNINTGLDFKVIEGLTLRGVFGADIFNDYRDSRWFPVSFYHNENTDLLVNTINQDHPRENWSKKAYLLNTQVMIDFARRFGKHNFSVLFGGSNESYTHYEHKIKVLYADLELGNFGDGSSFSPDSGVAPDWTVRTSISSLFGRVGYDWDDKYFLDASFRYDGASKFGSGYRWGFFPSVSLAWRLTEEAFMDSYRDRIGELKIRTSYGVLGNQGVDNYKYFTTYDVYTNTYAWDNVAVPGAGFTLGDDKLTWEKVHTFNIGVDATFLNNKLTVQADYYHRNTTDILVAPTIPLIFGTELSNHNAGKMESQGWELNVTYNHRKGDWRHSINFNMGDNWNKVTQYDGFEKFHTNGEVTAIQREGLPLNSYYGYKVAGIFQSYDEIAKSATMGIDVHPGDIKYVDRNGDGVIDENDRFYLGNAFPRYNMGLNYSVNWKGIELSVLLQGSLKRTQAVIGETVVPFQGAYSYVIYQHQLDFWTPTNTGAKYPRLGDSTNNWKQPSDIYMFDAKYLRVKDLLIGYNLPESVTKPLGMSNLRVYVNARNLLTFSKNSWIDPESSEFGNNFGGGQANYYRSYPTLKYYGFGVDITF